MWIIGMQLTNPVVSWQKLHLETAGTQFARNRFMQTCEESKLGPSWFGILVFLKIFSQPPHHHPWLRGTFTPRDMKLPLQEAYLPTFTLEGTTSPMEQLSKLFE